jgi:hypothetical protein
MYDRRVRSDSDFTSPQFRAATADAVVKAFMGLEHDSSLRFCEYFRHHLVVCKHKESRFVLGSDLIL